MRSCSSNAFPAEGSPVATGFAELPLHGGRVPPWLARIMREMAERILEIMVIEYGPGEVVRRLSDPYWFQAFNNIIGMDWDSSGSTTVTLGIIKEVTWRRPDLGVIVVGGKGKKMLLVPEETPVAVEKIRAPHDPAELVKASRLAAKADTALLQDGYSLYHHALIFSSDGEWAVIQQGMNPEKGYARRYHIYTREPPVLRPHTGVSGRPRSAVLNIVEDRGVERTQKAILDAARERSSFNEYASLYRSLKGVRSITSYLYGVEKESLARIPVYRPLPEPPRIRVVLKTLYEKQPRSMEELLLTRGLGPSTLRALALVADLVYGEPPSTRDPVTSPPDPFKYAYAIGGKDGVPYPVNPRRARMVLEALRVIVERARLGEKQRLRALRKLREMIEVVGGE